MAVIEPTNLLPHNFPAPARTRAGRRVMRRTLRAIRTVLIVLVVTFAVLSWTTRSSNPNIIRALGESATIRSVLSLLRSPSSVLEGEREDRITILLLGIGGEEHDGPLLADTILVASVQPSTRHATLVSIPRDLLIPLPNGTFEKANAINAYAEGAGGDGGAAICDALERTLGINISYYARIDFRGFAGLIDAIGGVDIDVERTLNDPQYPIAGMENAPWAERFERLVIPAGRQHMDGALALKYVRSRHALGVEGSDFARARRQQRLLLAVRDRAVSWGLLANPRRLLTLLDAWREHVRTNLSPPQLYRLSSFTSLMTGDDLTKVVFTDGPGGQLVARLTDGAYVLRPRDGSFDEMRAMIRDAFLAAPAATAPSAAAATQPLSIEIWNGTNVNGLAGTTADALRLEGLEVTAVRNAPSRMVERSMIYRNARVPDDIVAKLQELLRADVSTAFPAELTVGPLPDLLVILGSSSTIRQ